MVTPILCFSFVVLAWSLHFGASGPLEGNLCIEVYDRTLTQTGRINPAAVKITPA